ncbi:ABC transporter ATP-binding protein [Streptococcus sp. DD12]|uniref:ABC transporter ATP-binding protein n=1 Tax=Streptococcus sp. DD12 TaxID=1777880 RepID=UPI00079BF68E|nr:ATP-binding cassette domain-containing protein [Streptococcus sp. DD12]KXT76705.1 ABC transporter ATP-binding protein [Streptococcus sp. DD12]
MIILQANAIERSFSGDVLFDQINMQVNDRDRIALVGRNGAGKSTLLKILVGEEAPTQGDVFLKKDVSLAYLAQDSRFDSDQTIMAEMLAIFQSLRDMEKTLRDLEAKMGQASASDLETIMSQYDKLSERFRQLGGFTYEADIKAILNAFKFDESMWDMPISSLSGGQNTRLALARMLLQKPDLLVLDEPTNHLDIETISWLEGYLSNYQGALIIVSHDRYFLDKVTTITYDLTPHALERYVGNYSQFVDQKAQKMASLWQQYDKQQKEIAKLEDFVNRNIVRASTTKRAQARRKQLEKMDRLDKPKGDEKSAHMAFAITETSGNQVMQVENLVIGYDHEKLAGPIDLEVTKEDAIAIVGPNGIGKSTFVKTVIGRLPALTGSVRLGAKVSIGYYDQSQSTLSERQTVLEELWSAFPTLPELDIRNRLGAFLFSGDEVKKTVAMLSGGERARLLLAKLSMQGDNYLILDEPTNHLDIDSKEVLENALIDYAGTLLFVSHDRYFINRVATKVLEIRPDGAKLYLGDYDYYLRKKAEEEALARAKEEETIEASQADESQAQDYQAQKANQREARKLRRQLDDLENRLETLETLISQVSEQMMATNDSAELMALQEELSQHEDEQMTVLEEWETLAQSLEE